MAIERNLSEHSNYQSTGGGLTYTSSSVISQLISH